LAIAAFKETILVSLPREIIDNNKNILDNNLNLISALLLT
jgi:hypothetical protein